MSGSQRAVLEETREGDGLRLRPRGSWTVDVIETLPDPDRLAKGADAARFLTFDLSAVERLDTAGAWLLAEAAAHWHERDKEIVWEQVGTDHQMLLDEVREHLRPSAETGGTKPRRLMLLEDVGAGVIGAIEDIPRFLSFFGEIVLAFGRVIRHPSRIRVTSLIHHMEHVGLRAVPIVALISFLIGGIIAQQGAFQLRQFGAELFVVDLVGILVLREIGVLLASIMFAGRSGSAFTAELGSMKMREEIDALRIIGLDPLETLLLPRLMALVVVLPLVTVIGSLMCLVGAGLVLWVYSGFDPTLYLSRLRDAVTTDTLSIGLIKAPFMALIIGIVACIEGFKVAGSAESLGRHTTASVVKSIFLVIVVDGLFAMFFAAMDW